MAEDTVILKPVNNTDLSDVVICEGHVTVLGRGKGTGISSPGISRQHCELFWSKVPILQVTPLKKRAVIEKPEQQDLTVEVGQTAQLLPGDTLHPLAPKEICPASYRWPKPVHGSPITSAARTTQVLGHRVANGSQTVTAPAQPGGRCGIFQGCQAFFAIRLFASTLRQKFEELGGVVLERPTWQTTHVVAVSPQEPLEATEAYIIESFKRLSQHPPLPNTINRHGDDEVQIVSASLTRQAQYSRPSEHHGDSNGKLHMDAPDIPGKGGRVVSMAPGGSSKSEPICSVAERATFVTSEWVSKSIAMGALQNAANFALPTSKRGVVRALKRLAPSPQMRRFSKAPPSKDCAFSVQQSGQAPSSVAGPQQNHSAYLEPSAQDLKDNDKAVIVGLPQFASADEQIWHAAKAMLDIDKVSRPLDGSCEATVPGFGCQRWQPSGWTSSDWGVDGVWLEPYSSEDVFSTLTLLYNHYNRLDVKGGVCSYSASGHLDHDVKGGYQGHTPIPVSQGREVSDRSNKDEAMRESRCEHVACAHSAVCIVEEMQKVMAMYVKGRANDVHRMRAAHRAISAVKSFHRPLDTDEDVDELQLGQKSAEKIKSILHDGFLERNFEQQEDDEGVAFASFNRMWGIGGRRAQRWIAKGYRTAGDVLADEDEVADLTSRERTGLVHAKDLAKRVSREEVLVASRLVTQSMVQALQRYCGCSRDEAMQGLHCRPLGSFCRGKDEPGDCDMMIIPGDHLPWVCPQLLVSGVVSGLHNRGFLTEDLPMPNHPEQCQCPRSMTATFCGVCYVPGFPRVARRLDIKIMPATQRAVAVHYFTGTSLFNRAMRYWCDMPTPRVAELAAKLMPGGTEFHLGNHEFQVRAGEAPELEQRGASVSEPGSDEEQEDSGGAMSWKRPKACKTSRKARHPRACDIPVWCETDIFKAVGLSYVPPFMRFFHDCSA